MALINTYLVTFEGMYPVGGSFAVIRARDRGHARRLLWERLEVENLLTEHNRDIQLKAFEPIGDNIGIHVFQNGDY